MRSPAETLYLVEVYFTEYAVPLTSSSSPLGTGIVQGLVDAKLDDSNMDQVDQVVRAALEPLHRYADQRDVVVVVTRIVVARPG